MILFSSGFSTSTSSASSSRAIPNFDSATSKAVSRRCLLETFFISAKLIKFSLMASMRARKATPSLQLAPKSLTSTPESLKKNYFLKLLKKMYKILLGFYLLWQGICHPGQQRLPRSLLPFLGLHVATGLRLRGGCHRNTVQRADRSSDSMAQILQCSAVFFDLWILENKTLVCGI